MQIKIAGLILTVLVIMVLVASFQVSIKLPQEDIKWLVTTIIAVLGLLGGIPAIKKYYELKPNLKIKNITYHPNVLYIDIKNDSNHVATDVKCRWIIVESDTDIQIVHSGMAGMTEQVGYIGPNLIVEFMAPCYASTKHDLDIIIGLSCSEKDFKYDRYPLIRNR